MEKKLLSIVKILKAYHNILLGQKIIIWSDHNNLAHGEGTKNYNARMLRQRLQLEEFGPKIKYIEVEKNTVADSLSCLPLTDNSPSLETIKE